MIALVTGAAGFLGSHLCERLSHDGCTVIGVDDLSTGDERNLAALKALPAFTFHRCDVARELPPLPAVDRVYHLASPASPIDYARRPLETLRVNSAGTDRLCAFALESGARLLYASTSEIYGDPLEHPQRESYWGNVSSIGPRSCYDEGKRFGEAIVSAYRRTAFLDARIVRIFNTYGPRMRAGDGRVVPAFVTQALGGKPLAIFGDGLQTRSLCYVDDLIDGIVRAADTPAPFDVMNLGNDREVTILDIARIVAHVCGVELRTECFPLPPDDPQRRRPDLTRARETIDWRPRVDIEDGLRRTVEWFRERMFLTVSF